MYEDVATKFFEHFVYIGAAMNRIGGARTDCGTKRTASTTTCCSLPDGAAIPIKAQTIVGLIPIFAVAVADREARGSIQRIRASACAGSRRIAPSCCAASPT